MWVTTAGGASYAVDPADNTVAGEADSMGTLGLFFPLACAAFKWYTDVARALLDAGADPDAGAPSARAAAQMFARTEILDLLG